jgi:ribosome recycling factor
MDYANERVNELLFTFEEDLEKKMNYVKSELSLIRAGRVSPSIVERVTVDYFGEQTPLKNIAGISCQDARTIIINPWDAATLREIVKVLGSADLGASPVDDGRVVRLIFPPLTEETRKGLVKKIKKVAEDGRIAMRNERRSANDTVKKIKNEDKLGEDEAKGIEEDIQKILDGYIDIIDKLYEQKEKDILTI